MTFHDVRFSTEISYGAVGGPSYNVEVVELANGREIRRLSQASSRRNYSIGSGVKTAAQLYEILEFYEARMGKLIGFRWKDWIDFKSCEPDQKIRYNDQIIGRGDDENKKFQLMKTYRSGGYEVERKITKPVRETLRVGVDEREYKLGEEFEIDWLTGVIEFLEPPESGAPVYAGFEFDVPVRFDCENLAANLEHFEAGEIPNILVIEILE